MKGKVIGVFIVLLSIVLLVGVAVVGAQEGEPPPRGQIVSSRSDPAWKPVRTEWTLERMQNAKPYPMPAVEGTPHCEGAAAPTGAPGLIPSGPEEVEYSLPDVLGSIERFTASAESTAPLGYPYPPPYTRYEVFKKYTSWPYRTVGVLFFTQNGIDYRCSASSIGNHAIWTAGHCVNDGAGNWSYDLYWIPAYKNGAPAASWAVWTPEYNLWTFTDWRWYGDLCRDSGGAVMYPEPTRGRKVSWVGWLGFAWNWPRVQHWHEIGYPSAPPFDGNKQFICASSHSRDDDPCYFTDNPDTIGAGCDQTPGCSGGPWIKDFSGKSGLTNYLNGNFSYYYSGYPEEMFSPYFDDLSYDLWYALVNDAPP